MDLELAGRVAIVTGASRGIGRAIALAFAREGVKLVVCARGAAGLEAIASELRAAGSPAVVPIAVDVADATSPSVLVGAAAELGGVDVLVSNAGGNRRKPFEEVTDADWQELLELNLLSGLRIARACVAPMRSKGRGAMLFVSSIWGREAGGHGYTLYNGTKSALISVAKIMAGELARDGIRVNTIAPGSILFPGGGWEQRQQSDPEGIASFVARDIPSGRFGTPEEVADLAVYLASGRASWITGACLTVDGGQSKSLI